VVDPFAPARACYLHLKCLEKRLGSKLLRGRDLLLWAVSSDRHGVHIAYHPDYINSPEFAGGRALALTPMHLAMQRDGRTMERVDIGTRIVEVREQDGTGARYRMNEALYAVMKQWYAHGTWPLEANNNCQLLPP
jgi:hypothetical protein